MKDIIMIAVAVLLFGVVVLTAVLIFRETIREIEHRNNQRRKAIEDEAQHRKECRDELFNWWARVSNGGRI